MKTPEPDTETDKTPENKQEPSQESVRAHRKYAVSSNKGKAKGKIRYIETNDPAKGCRFL